MPRVNLTRTRMVYLTADEKHRLRELAARSGVRGMASFIRLQFANAYDRVLEAKKGGDDRQREIEDYLPGRRLSKRARRAIVASVGSERRTPYAMVPLTEHDDQVAAGLCEAAGMPYSALARLLIERAARAADAEILTVPKQLELAPKEQLELPAPATAAAVAGGET